MRSAIVLLTLLAACATKDDRPLQGGGGHGGSGTGATPDASIAFDDAGDAGNALSGTVCVVTDLRSPFGCADLPASHDVLVAEVGGGSTRSDTTGAFTLATAHASPLVEVGSEAGDGLVTTRYVTYTADSPVDVPVVDETTWESTLITLSETQTTGAMLIYVVDANGSPVSGATVSYDGAGSPGARIYYDNGAGSFDPNAISTGSAGIALVLDTAAADMRADLGVQTATASVPTTDGGIGVAVLAFP